MDNRNVAGTVNIFLLHHPRIELDGKVILNDLNTKALILILYLAANEEKIYSRDALSELLWPDLPAENSRSNLRQVLSSIKKACASELHREDSIIASDKGNCFINGQIKLFVDLPAFYCGIEAGMKENNIALLQGSVDLYVGSFLEGFYVKGSAVLDEWILFERESACRALREGCKVLAMIYEKQGSLDKAAQCLNKLIKTDQLQEDVHRELMALYYKKGDRNQAIAQYNQCVKLLRKELNISPMEETKKLYEQILNEDSKKPPKGSAKEGKAVLTDILKYRNHYLVNSPCQLEQLLDLFATEEGKLFKIAFSGNPFGSAAYEGFYSLLQPVLQKKKIVPQYIRVMLETLFPELSSEEKELQQLLTTTAEGGLHFTRMLHGIESLISAFAIEVKGLVIKVQNYDCLDKQTQMLLCFLLDNLNQEKVHIIISYKDENNVKELIAGFHS